jgi:hypothetical protein
LNKKFDSELYKEFDKFGKNIAKKYFYNHFKIKLTDNSDPYGVDLNIIINNDKIIGNVEVEVRTNWKTNNFPYSTLNIPKRKEKFFINKLPCYFMSINKIGTRAFLCDSKIILLCKFEEVRNKFVGEEEYFYKVPIEKLLLINLEE